MSFHEFLVLKSLVYISYTRYSSRGHLNISIFFFYTIKINSISTSTSEPSSEKLTKHLTLPRLAPPPLLHSPIPRLHLNRIRRLALQLNPLRRPRTIRPNTLPHLSIPLHRPHPLGPQASKPLISLRHRPNLQRRLRHRRRPNPLPLRRPQNQRPRNLALRSKSPRTTVRPLPPSLSLLSNQTLTYPPQPTSKLPHNPKRLHPNHPPRHRNRHRQHAPLPHPALNNPRLLLGRADPDAEQYVFEHHGASVADCVDIIYAEHWTGVGDELE
jgi:hypothetical protein